jgi:dCTP deaminase
MSLLSDTEIVNRCKFVDAAMIRPFSPISRTDCAPGFVGPSWGLSSTGYDIRLSDKWKIPRKENFGMVYQTSRKETVKFDPNSVITLEDRVANEFLLMPGEFVLAVSHEHFKMPCDVMGLCTGKSTLARMGLIVLVTPLEVGWEGYLTLEMFNAGHQPINLTAGIGICQINFFKTEEPPHKSYMHRSGKYMHQLATPVEAILG